MSRRRRGSALAFPAMMTELSCASYEVIARRTLMMVTGTCSSAEYWRVVHEKTAAATSTLRLVTNGGPASAASLLAPWHSRATANAKRLRRT